jgi:hypothetical protein
VSANAFDKSLDNAVGITADDFMVKPVRVTELLDWLGRRLQLEWIEVQRTVITSVPSDVPSDSALRRLDEQIQAGYVRGVHKVLDQIAQAEPHCDGFVQRLRDMARQFQLDAMAALVKDTLAESASKQDLAT